MSIRQSAGPAGTPFRLDVEPGKVAEFARSVRGDADAVATAPTFLITSQLWAGPESTVIDHGPELDRTLHAEMEFVFLGSPPTVGAQLVATSRVTGKTVKTGRRGGRMRFTEVTTEFVDDSGATVARTISTTVVVGEPDPSKQLRAQ